MVRWFLKELCPFYFENNTKFSVSVHYLPNSITHSTQTWHMHTSKNCTGQVWIWSKFNDFWRSYAPFTWKILWNSLVSVHYFPNNITHSTQTWYIWIHQRHAQVKFEFGHGSMIFGRVMPLSLWKKKKNFQFLFITSPMVLHIQLKLDICIRQTNVQVKFEFGNWFNDFWQSYAPFTLKIIWNFQFPFIISPTVLHI
jgi:hypothetical protein